MGDRDVLITEVGAAFAILGLLLVFLPLFLEAAKAATGGVEPANELRARRFRAKLVAGTIALAAAAATTGLFGLWLDCDPLAAVTGGGLLVLTWCVVLLGVMAVATST